MRYPFAEIFWIHGSTSKIVKDPRVAISGHIGWVKPYERISDFKFPEPDNYNHAIYTTHPIECKFIENQVLYRPKKDKFWWSVYHVPKEQEEEFMAWLHTLQVRIYWRNEREQKDRNRKTLLWSKKNATVLTENENLYLTGYYENFRSKYFEDDGDWMQTHLGSPRENLESLTLAYDIDPEDRVIS
jgi:hypothetical protein